VGRAGRDVPLATVFESNFLLRTVDRSLSRQFASRFHHFELRRGNVLHDQGHPAVLVFPFSGLVAILSETLAGESVQTGMVGCDGAIGAAEALGSGQFLSKAIVQVSGVGVRLSANHYRDLLESSNAFRTASERHMEAQLVEARQIVACNALHTVESRLARSILEALERSCLKQTLPITQEGLSQMLGVQRTTVAVLLSKLQREGLLRNGRGAIEVLDKPGLERTACSCRETLLFARSEIGVSNDQLTLLWSSRPPTYSPGRARQQVENGGASSAPSGEQ
jgi:CRP-like cAMP-binding protein